MNCAVGPANPDPTAPCYRQAWLRTTTHTRTPTPRKTAPTTAFDHGMNYGPADGLAKPYRDCISDQSGHWRNGYGFAILDKRIVLREGLQERAFPQRDGTVLSWMTETTIAVAVKLRRNGWGRSVPSHSAIDAWVRSAAITGVAGRAQPIIPITPSAAGLGTANALQVRIRQSTGLVKWV